MAGSANDIKAIYSSYNLEKYRYVEIKQTESYIQAKNKWLIFHSKASDYSDTNTPLNKDLVSAVEVV